MIVYLGDVYFRELEPSVYPVRATITQVSNSNQPNVSNTQVGVRSALGVVLRGVRYLGQRGSEELQKIPLTPLQIAEKLAEADSTNY